MFKLKNKQEFSYFGYFVLLMSHKYICVTVFTKLILLEERLGYSDSWKRDTYKGCC